MLNTQPTIGMHADDVLKLPNYAKVDATQDAKAVGHDGVGRVVAWYYPGETLTLQRVNGPYRVTKIVRDDLVITGESVLDAINKIPPDTLAELAKIEEILNANPS